MQKSLKDYKQEYETSMGIKKPTRHLSSKPLARPADGMPLLIFTLVDVNANLHVSAPQASGRNTFGYVSV